MHHRNHTHLILSLLILLMSGCAAATSGQSSTSTNAASFQTAKCPMPLSGPNNSSIKYTEGQNITCGYLTVKEDRQQATSPNIKLAVAVIKGTAPNHQADPILMLSGGPGGELLKEFDFYVSAGRILSQVGKRDIILMDQRGTGYSQPSLQCTELIDLTYTLLDQNISLADSIKQSEDATQKCHDRLVNNHVNLSAYTTVNDANDMHDLIGALGYQQVNVYGVSYGTRLALEMMRSFPQKIRSVVLDSVDPPQLNIYKNVPHAMARVFDTLFAGCNANPFCSSKYPQLRDEFDTLLTQADANPITLTLMNSDTNKSYPALIHGSDIANAIFQMLYETDIIGYVPQTIDQASHGNYRLLSIILGAVTFNTSVSTGMYYSVNCGEDAPYATNQDIESASQVLEPAIRTDSVMEQEAELTTCGLWHVNKVDASLKQPVTSVLPTLVMEGEYDPITPPSNGDDTAQHLSHSYKVLFPGTGHGGYLSAQPCPVQILQAFVDAPNQKPDDTCESGIPYD